ncbi:hypothetical protein ACFFGH_33900 [Lysobacter korlensis]|uniref:Uncharacterized protein n=1 Tax=Lysobacter korlensis TaxID=553636 RepID=A0ABV6S404_9GAMM
MGLVISSLLLAGATTATGQAPAPSSAAPEAAVSICHIRQNPEQYVGRAVTVSGIYKTDSSHYSYLLDPSCSSQSTLDLGFEVPERDASVAAFEAAKAEECKRTGQRGLCVLEASVVLRGEIASTKGAHLQPDLVYLIINPHSVLTYRFRAER